MQSFNLTYKICLLGPATVGKTTFLTRHLTGEFEKAYIPTNGIDIHTLTFSIASISHPELPNRVTFTICDTSGKELNGGIISNYLTDCDGAIVMSDLKTDISHILSHYINVLGPNSPIVLCTTKCDIKQHTSPKDIENSPIIKEMRKRKLPFYQISSRSNYNFEKPFLSLLRSLTGVNDIVFSENTPVIPPMCYL